VKPITDFDAKHLKGGGFRGNISSAFSNSRSEQNIRIKTL